MTDYVVNVTSELAAIHGQVGTSLSHAAGFATLSDQFARLPEELELPDPKVVLQMRGAESASSAVRSRYSSLACSLAVVAMVSAFEVYLSRLLLIRRLAEQIRSRGKISGDEFNNLRRRVGDEARSRPTRLVKKLVTSPSDNLLGALEWLEGIYRLRVCLAHREGIVDLQDVDEKGLMVAKWRKTEFRAGDALIDKLPVVIDARDGPVSITVGFVDDERTWRLGERIEVNPGDCQQMAFALSQLALWLMSELNSEIKALAGLNQPLA